MASPDRVSQITDLVNQWEQIAGHGVTIPKWMIDEMADSPFYVQGHAIQSLYDVGQYMAAHVGEDGAHTWNGTQFASMPWAQYGLDHAQYQQMYNTSSDVYFQMTGQQLDKGVWDYYMRGAEGQLNASTMRSMLLKDGNALQAFGWLKLGLDFQQFQQAKQQMATGLGVADPNAIDNSQALLQLQYSHRNAGSTTEVAARPTLTQQEKKTADVGVGQSAVR